MGAAFEHPAPNSTLKRDAPQAARPSAPRQAAGSHLPALHHLHSVQSMSTVRPGNQPSLVVVDVQVGVMAGSWEASRVIKNVARAVERAREVGVPVIWVQHEADDMPRDSSSWQLVPELVPAVGEKRVYKRFPSSFEDTDLEENLARTGTTALSRTGANLAMSIPRSRGRPHGYARLSRRTRRASGWCSYSRLTSGYT